MQSVELMMKLKHIFLTHIVNSTLQGYKETYVELAIIGILGEGLENNYRIYNMLTREYLKLRVVKLYLITNPKYSDTYTIEKGHK